MGHFYRHKQMGWETGFQTSCLPLCLVFSAPVPFFHGFLPWSFCNCKMLSTVLNSPLFLPSFALRELPPSVPLRPFHPPILPGPCPLPPFYFTTKYFSHQHTALLVFKSGFVLETYLPFTSSLSTSAAFTCMSLMEYHL